MVHRSLPDLAEARAILAAKRTRPAYRAPLPAGRQLAPLLKDLSARFSIGPQALTTRWREIAGAMLARRTEPVKLVKPRGGGPATLEVRVDGPAATLLQHQAPDLIARVNLVLGAEAVGRLRIVQGPVRAPAANASVDAPGRTRLRRSGAPPLDAAAEAELTRSLKDAPEGRLKTALEALGRAALARIDARPQRP